MLKGFAAVWRSSNPGLAIPVLSIVTLVVLASRGMPWRGEWQWTINWAVGSTVLTGPLVTGLSAYEASKWRSTVRELLIPGGERRFVALVTPTIGPVCSAITAYCLGIVGAAALSVSVHPTDSFAPEVVILGALLIAVYAAVGAAVGQYLQPFAAAAVGVAVGYAFVLSSSTGVLRFLRVGGSTGPLSGLDVSRLGALSQASLLLGTSALAIALAALRAAALGRILKGSAFVAAIAFAIGIATHANPLYYVDSGAHWRCEGSVVQTCLLLGNTTHLPEWSSEMTAMSAPFRQIGFVFPTKYKQPLPTANIRDESAGELFYDPSTVNVSPPTRDLVILSLASPAACRAFASDRAPVGALMARSWLASWMKSQVDTKPDLTADPSFTAWKASTSLDSQRSWARVTFRALKTCDVDRARIPVESQ